MRTIKFRAKTLDNLWVEGNFHYMLFNESDNPLYYDWKKYPVISNSNCHFKIDIETLSQYTNQKDSLGNELYEGDIVKWNCKITHGPEESGIGEVFWNYSSAGFVIGREELYSFNELCYVEKIGNIFDKGE